MNSYKIYVDDLSWCLHTTYYTIFITRSLVKYVLNCFANRPIAFEVWLLIRQDVLMKNNNILLLAPFFL